MFEYDYLDQKQKFDYCSYNNQTFVFDPDSHIQTIKVSVRTVETDQQIINEAISQDKIIFSPSQGNDFEVVEIQFTDLQEASCKSVN